MKSRQGFSLIEMAFVLVIVTLLLGGLLVPFTTQVEQKRIAETQKALDEAKEALIGYALTHGYLPCPDKTTPGTVPGSAGPPIVPPSIPNDGQEDFDAVGQCRDYVGNFPWATLGVGAVDAWGNRLRYQVSPAFAIHTATYLTLSSAGSLRVCQDAACATVIASNIPAVILSFGKNGYGAINANRLPGDVTTIPCPAAGCSTDEQMNMHNFPSQTFVSRVITPTGVAAGEFDDLVTWLSPNVLFNRMVAAGKLP